LVAWQDARGGEADIYVQHTDPAGILSGWPANGLAVCTASGEQIVPQIVSDAAGGAIVAWMDKRGANTQIYAARVAGDSPVTTLASLVRAEATDRAVRLEWFGGSPAASITLERRTEATGWTPLAQLSAPSNGLITYEDRNVVPNRRYGYRLAIGPQYTAETWVAISAVELALEGPRPNPTVALASVALSLPDDGPARLEVVDIAGRLRLSREVGSLGAGRHLLSLAGAVNLAPGVYLMRLVHARGAVSQRLMITR
jgi:hypothetical protein